MTIINEQIENLLKFMQKKSLWSWDNSTKVVRANIEEQMFEGYTIISVSIDLILTIGHAAQSESGLNRAKILSKGHMKSMVDGEL